MGGQNLVKCNVKSPGLNFPAELYTTSGHDIAVSLSSMFIFLVFNSNLWWLISDYWMLSKVYVWGEEKTFKFITLIKSIYKYKHYQNRQKFIEL